MRAESLFPLAARSPLISTLSPESALFHRTPLWSSSTATKPSSYAEETTIASVPLTGGKGRYTQADPLGHRGDPHPYLYASANPLAFVDPTGEASRARTCCTPIAGGAFTWLNIDHCFIELNEDTGSTTFSLHRVSGAGCKYVNDGFDKGRIGNPATKCGPWKEGCDTEMCIRKAHDAYPNPTEYDWLGTNSNTYASTLTSTCGLTPPPIAGTWHTPGWGQGPAKPKNAKCPEIR